MSLQNVLFESARRRIAQMASDCSSLIEICEGPVADDNKDDAWSHLAKKLSRHCIAGESSEASSNFAQGPRPRLQDI